MDNFRGSRAAGNMISAGYILEIDRTLKMVISAPTHLQNLAPWATAFLEDGERSVGYKILFIRGLISG